MSCACRVGKGEPEGGKVAQRRPTAGALNEGEPGRAFPVDDDEACMRAKELRHVEIAVDPLCFDRSGLDECSEAGFDTPGQGVEGRVEVDLRRRERRPGAPERVGQAAVERGRDARELRRLARGGVAGREPRDQPFPADRLARDELLNDEHGGTVVVE